MGKVQIVEGDSPFAVLSSLAILRPKENVDARYLAHALRSPAAMDQAARRKTGSAIRRIILSDLARVSVPLPPLNDQRRIAAILDHADALRAQRRCVIDALHRLAGSVFSRLVNVVDEFSQLGEVADFFAGGSLPPGEPFAGQSGGYFHMKVSDMNRPGNETTIRSCAEWSDVPGPRSATCPAGSIVIPKRGGAISTNKKRVTLRPTVLDPNLMAVHPRDGLSLCYLKAWFDQFDLNTIVSGSSVPQLNKRDLAPLAIPVPSAEAQSLVTELTSSMDHRLDRARLSLAMHEELSDSLQARAFSGQL